MKMKYTLALAAALLAGQAGAHGVTNPLNHATRPELAKEAKTRAEADKHLQSQINGAVAAGQGAYNELKVDISHTNDSVSAVNSDLQSSKAAGLAIANGLNNKIDGAITTQAGVNFNVQQQITGAIDSQNVVNGQLQNGVNDAKGAAVNAQNTADVAVGLGQKGINDAYNAQVTANTAVGIGQDAKNTAVNAQNSANHAEGTAQAAGNAAVNAQNTANYAVGQGQKNANDIVNVSNVATSAYNNAAVAQQGVNTNAAAIKSTNAVVAGHTTQISNLDQRTSVNTTNIQNTNAVVNQHTSQISNHESRISAGEAVNARQDEALQQNAAQWQTQGQINNEYGARLDNQDAMAGKFAADIGNVRSQVAQMNDGIRRADQKAEKAQNMAAAAYAAAALQFNVDQAAGVQLAGGAATLGGKQAMAIGVGGAVSENLFFSGIATKSTGVSGGAVSATYSFR